MSPASRMNSNGTVSAVAATTLHCQPHRRRRRMSPRRCTPAARAQNVTQCHLRTRQQMHPKCHPRPPLRPGVPAVPFILRRSAVRPAVAHLCPNRPTPARLRSGLGTARIWMKGCRVQQVPSSAAAAGAECASSSAHTPHCAAALAGLPSARTPEPSSRQGSGRSRHRAARPSGRARHPPPSLRTGPPALSGHAIGATAPSGPRRCPKSRESGSSGGASAMTQATVLGWSKKNKKENIFWSTNCVRPPVRLPHSVAVVRVLKFGLRKYIYTTNHNPAAR
ncbi:uncharacterized protein V1510DRAFT_312026 [Dipodascopsis tothii]|uniref:uncharacterized protein n=1 Tax=Dipodascopsis tothii TaxID=44089 RepID=UPI0034CFE14D